MLRRRTERRSRRMVSQNDGKFKILPKSKFFYAAIIRLEDNKIRMRSSAFGLTVNGQAMDECFLERRIPQFKPMKPYTRSHKVVVTYKLQLFRSITAILSRFYRSCIRAVLKSQRRRSTVTRLIRSFTNRYFYFVLFSRKLRFDRCSYKWREDHRDLNIP